MAKKQDAVWQVLEVEALPQELQSKYAEMKRIYHEYKAAKDGFEAAFNAAVAKDLPAGHKAVFGYNFGKLSVAIVIDETQPKKPAVPKLSLAEFMRLQRADGRAN